MLQAARRTAYATGCALAIAGWIFPVAMNAAVAQSAPSTATWPADFVLTKATLDCAGRELDVSMTSGPLEYTLWIGKHARMPDVDRFSVTVTPVGKPSGENAAMAFMDNAVLIVTSNGLQDPFDMHGKTAMAKPAARIRPGTSDYDRRYLPANLVMIAGGHLRRILLSRKPGCTCEATTRHRQRARKGYRSELRYAATRVAGFKRKNLLYEFLFSFKSKVEAKDLSVIGGLGVRRGWPRLRRRITASKP